MDRFPSKLARGQPFRFIVDMTVCDKVARQSCGVRFAAACATPFNKI